jgi:hypothetical protein
MKSPEKRKESSRRKVNNGVIEENIGEKDWREKRKMEEKTAEKDRRGK